MVDAQTNSVSEAVLADLLITLLCSMATGISKVGGFRRLFFLGSEYNITTLYDIVVLYLATPYY